MKQNKNCYNNVVDWAKKHKINVVDDFVILARYNHTTQNLSCRLSIDEVKEVIITEDRENIFSFIFEFFYMPIVAAGKFLSDNISRVNVFVFILDFIIEAPFKVVVEIVEDWTRYLKEKKEDLA